MSAGVHASAVVLGEAGVLLRGPSGAGKSLLALALVDRVRGGGRFAALVADDRVWLETAGGRLIARGDAATAGLCERRGLGLVAAPYEPQAVVRLVLDLAPRGETPSRMPEADDLYATIGGVRLPRLPLDLAPGLEGAVLAALAGLERIAGATWRKNVLVGEVFA